MFTLVLLTIAISAAALRAADCVRCHVADDLKQRIVAPIQQNELTIASDAAAILDAVVDHAARRLERDDFSDGKMAEAQRNASELGKRIVEATISATSAPTSRPTATTNRVVTKEVIRTVLDKICPLYPFCP